MSYCASGWDGSDVYVYKDVTTKHIVCWGSCGCFKSVTAKGMIEHLQNAHIRQGECVPDYAIERLQGEVQNED